MCHAGSSVHAVGYTSIEDMAAAPVLLTRPNGFYGFSKVAIEALGSLYADRRGLGVVSARLGTTSPYSTEPRHPSTWISPADLARLVRACLRLATPGHPHRVADLSAGEVIGYHPQDDARTAAPGKLTMSLTDTAARLSTPATLLGASFVADDHPRGRPR